MFLFALWVCLHVQAAATTSDGGEESTWFGLYAGNLLFSEYTDGSCIACDGDCNGSSAVSPHSWTAKLVYVIDNVTHYKDQKTCQGYAQEVAKHGVVAFTWRKANHSCSLHVKGETYNLGAEMVNHNGFDWVEEHPNNTGDIILVTYPKNASGVDTYCFVGLDINQTPNITKLANTALIIFVVVVITAWIGWMNHTDNYPPSIVGHDGSPETSDDNHKLAQGIYRQDSPERHEE